MTGLDEASHHIMEIAALVTDSDLKPLDEGVDLVVHQPATHLALMCDVVSKMHDSSGLTKACLASQLTLEEAEAQTMAYILSHVPQKHTAPLCGNSVHTDRRFLRKFMPQIDDHLHYRIVDVSSVREVGERWLPKTWAVRPKKKERHRALEDIHESIAELQFYRERMFLTDELSDWLARGGKVEK